MMNINELENAFNNFLLSKIVISNGKKILRRGILKLISIKNHNCKFYIEENNTLKIIEFNYPFNIKISENKIELIYHIDELIKVNPKIINYINNFNNKSKYFNSTIIFKKITK